MSHGSGRLDRLQGPDQLEESANDPFLVQGDGDLTWAEDEFVECIFEEFPFLRKAPFRALLLFRLFQTLGILETCFIKQQITRMEDQIDEAGS